jgi:hypothetical protein
MENKNSACIFTARTRVSFRDNLSTFFGYFQQLSGGYHPLGDHLNTCTAHSGAKKAHDWMVDQVADLFRTTQKVRTQHVVTSRGQQCGDIQLEGYLTNEAGPVPLVLDLRIAHDRMGSSADPSLNGHLKHPNNLDQLLNDAACDKIRKYRTDYNNRPPSAVSFMTVIASTSGRLHSEFVRILFLQAHRETDRFFAASGVQLAQTHPGGLSCRGLTSVVR